MPVLMKQIKPKRLKAKEMRLTMLNAGRKAGTQIKKDYELTTATWDKKPEFKVVVSLAGGAITVLVDTNDKIYFYVSKGTPAHPIRPKRAKALRFQAKYKSKTVSGVIGSRPGGSYGDVKYSKGVIHPGIKAREFDKLIKKKRERWFKRQMERAMIQVAKESGHVI